MKRGLLILCFLLLISSSIFAQPFSLGFRAGLNSNNYVINTENFTAKDAQFGFVGGLFINLKFGALSIQPEMLYSQKNGLFSFTSIPDGIDTLFHNKIKYFDYPILLNFHLGDVLRIGTGPVFSQVTSEVIHIQDSESELLISIDKKVFKEVSYGWQFAAVINIGKLFFDVRFEYGIDKLSYGFEIPSSNIILSPDIKSQMWQFTIGYKLIGK